MYIARFVIMLKQYYIIKCNPSLNIVKIAGGVWTIPVVTPAKRAMLKSKYSIDTYVYFNGVLIAIAESGLHLSRITGVSRSIVSYYTSGKDNITRILYGKFIISLKVPSLSILTQLLNSSELIALFDNARAASRSINYKPNSISITVTDIFTNNKKYMFSSITAASKFKFTTAN